MIRALILMSVEMQLRLLFCRGSSVGAAVGWVKTGLGVVVVVVVGLLLLLLLAPGFTWTWKPDCSTNPPRAFRKPPKGLLGLFPLFWLLKLLLGLLPNCPRPPRIPPKSMRTGEKNKNMQLETWLNEGLDNYECWGLHQLWVESR